MREPDAYFRCNAETMQRLARLFLGGKEGEIIKRIRIAVGDRELDNPVVVSAEVPPGVIESWRDGRLLASISLQKHPITHNGSRRKG